MGGYHLNDSLRLGTLVASDMVGEVVSAEDKYHKDLEISQAAKVLLKEVCSFEEQLVSLMAEGDSNIEPLKSEVPKAVNVAVNKLDPKLSDCRKPWLIVKRSCRQRKKNKNDFYHPRAETLTRMVNNIQDRCTYRDGVCCGSLWKGNKHA